MVPAEADIVAPHMAQRGHFLGQPASFIAIGFLVVEFLDGLTARGVWGVLAPAGQHIAIKEGDGWEGQYKHQ